MIEIDQTYPAPAKNIAFEQWLLEQAERKNSIAAESSQSASGYADEYLRFWKPSNLFVVMGRSGRFQDEVDYPRCLQDGVEVLRRSSGGGTILTGPGCLMYSVVLSLHLRPDLRDISRAHQFVGERLREAFLHCGQKVVLRGHSDLCVGNRKFSGNALRIGRTHLLYHGTLLLDFQLDQIPCYLRMPPRQPDYRGSRNHLDFVTNLPIEIPEIQAAISSSFDAHARPFNVPDSELEELIHERYGQESWNLRI